MGLGKSWLQRQSVELDVELLTVQTNRTYSISLLSKIDKKELLKWNNEEVIQGTS